MITRKVKIVGVVFSYPLLENNQAIKYIYPWISIYFEESHHIPSNSNFLLFSQKSIIDVGKVPQYTSAFLFQSFKIIFSLFLSEASFWAPLKCEAPKGKLGKNNLIIKHFQYFINYACEKYTQRINIFILILNYTLIHLL